MRSGSCGAMRRWALILLWCALGSLAHSGEIYERDGKTVIRIVVDRLPDPTNTATFNRAEAAAVSAFIEQFPQIFAERYRDQYRANPEKYGRFDWDHVEVEPVRFSGITVEGVETDLLAIAGGMPPDVLYVNFRKSDNYIRNGFLYPLDKSEDGYVSGMSDAALAQRVNPKIWPVIRCKGPAGEKHVWALPYGGALGKVLLYRKDLFDLNGVPYPDKEWTWDDMLAACRKLTDPAKGTYGLLLTRAKDESWWWVTFLWSAGGEAMVYDEASDQWRCAFDSDEAAVALDFYTRLSTEKWTGADGKLHRGYSTKDAADLGSKWERGEIGMRFDYVDGKLFSRINPEVVGMCPVPKGPTGIRGAELNSRMMGLFSRIEHPAVRDAAWEYIRFFESEEALQIKTRIMVEGGLGKYFNPELLERFGYKEFSRLSPKGWAENFRIAIETGKPEPYGRNSNVIYDVMTRPIHLAEQLALNDELPEDPDARLAVMKGLLEQWNARANEIMIGAVPPKERSKRRAAALFALLLIAVAFGFAFRRVMRAFQPPEAPGVAQLKWGFRKYAWAYVLLLPAALTILVWQYAPLAYGSGMAFFDYKLLGDSAWTGLDNFGDVLFDGEWWRAVWNAVRYSFLVMALTFLPPIALAILLQEAPYGRLIFRTIYYLPAVITGLVTALLWKQFYEPSESGALNSIVLQIPAIGYLIIGAMLLGIALMFARRLWRHELRGASLGFAVAGLLLLYTALRITAPIFLHSGETLFEALPHWPGRLFECMPEPLRWLGNPETSMLACVMPMVWAGMGPGCLIYLAALKGIPDEIYESADIDGGTFIDKIIFIVFPMLKALILINFIGAFIGSVYAATGHILVMTGGAANTEVAGLHIWYQAFTHLRFGPATAMAWLLGFMLIGFTMNQLRILSRVEFKTTGEK
ncbi:extracellular solute-binding protein [Candidatus Sumerlaeota bacterium]|nr:extracellular solute-binding protein [Candidatus Sumerlaeota bacterium]